MLKTRSEIIITPSSIVLDGQRLETWETGIGMLNEAYRRYVNDYPKFFKMDGLCKLGFIASELLLSHLGEERFTPREDRAIVLFNSSGSIEADVHYQKTISDPEDFFPSPSLFVYTLPNIVTGEIAIRNKYLGETSFYVLEEYNEQAISDLIGCALTDDSTTSVLCGWMDFYDQTRFEARVEIRELRVKS